MNPGRAESLPIVIVGAGLAGLAAARALAARRPIILEKEAAIGGRVLTRRHGGVPCELGAIFAPDADLLPPVLQQSPVIEETGPIGLWSDGRWRIGETPAACIEAMGISPEEATLLRAFANGALSPRDLSPRLFAPLNAFFRLIHPGDIRDYLPSRHRDSLLRFETRHLVEGNAPLLRTMADEIDLEIVTRAEVVTIRDLGDRVEVRHLLDGRKETLFAAAVISAMDAAAARSVIETIAPPAADFLARIRHGDGGIVALGFPDQGIPDLAYGVMPGLPYNAVIAQRHPGRNVRTLHLYAVGEEARRLPWDRPDEMARSTLAILTKTGLVPAGLEPLFFDSHYWPRVGPIIDATAYAAVDAAALRPSPRIILAGDYTAFEPEAFMPYGMHAAILSGRRAAREAESLMNR
jgi:hypothetical protein